MSNIYGREFGAGRPCAVGASGYWEGPALVVARYEPPEDAQPVVRTPEPADGGRKTVLRGARRVPPGPRFA